MRKCQTCEDQRNGRSVGPVSRCERCGEPAVMWVDLYGVNMANVFFGGLLRRECRACGCQHALGPSNDEPEAVKVEMAAARRATERRPDEIAAIDDAGCIYSVGEDNCRECQSWHLARVIATHQDPTRRRR